ncbi:MAG: hypothetical protein JXR37_32175 [Kiritimatiellae bacterium]|nr:hypothetical protein [Kiritimatiellia bacterium]
MKPRDCVIEQLRHRPTSPVPFTFPFEPEIGEALDTYYGGREWRRRLTPYIVQVRTVDTDGRAPVDDTHARDTYGGLWRMDRRPWHLEKPPLREPSFAGYTFPDAGQFFRPDCKEQALRTCERCKDSFLLGKIGWGLFERSWCMRGFENALTDMVLEPAFYTELLAKLTDLYLAFTEYTLDLPVDGIFFADDWGDQRGVIMGPDRWRQFIKPNWARIYACVHRRGKKVFSHSCGALTEILPDMIEMGLDVLESVQPEAAGMNPYELKERWGGQITFWGCLGSQSTIARGTPEDVREEVGRLVREMGRGGGFILAPAKPLQPGTPIENAAAILEAAANQASVADVEAKANAALA